MFKAWQVFLFSLIPLALVFAGVIGGSVHGLDSEREVFKAPTPGPVAPPGGGTSPTGAGGGVTLTLVAKDLKFDKRTLSAPPNTQVTVVLDNQDAGVLHNFALYTNNRATTKVFVGELFAGRASRSSVFTTPRTPGNYFFRCDVHPDTMTGTLTVR